jgi:phosphoglycerate dehydrogenase-like enzyme
MARSVVVVASPRVAVAPEGARAWLADAVTAGGATLVGPGSADALVWALPAAPGELAETLDANPQLRWIQLPWAGIEPYVEVVRAHADRTWTCGKGVYAEPVAELALSLLVAGFRGLGTYTRATTWGLPQGRNLLGAHVVIAGGGGITESLLRLLAPFGCDITVVRRTDSPLAGADRVVAMDGLDDALRAADALVLALALTPETDHLIDRRRLDLLGEHGWVINVARGRHIVTDDLVEALDDGTIGGAGLDVTDPEPLPERHPLWAFRNVLITPHVGNTPEMAVPLLSGRITENVRRWASGATLLGPVDPAAGY